MKIAVILLAVVATAMAAPTYEYKKAQYPSYQEKENYNYGPVEYYYNYAVKDDYSYVDFGAKENRKGDYTDGSYYVALPDGRVQYVNYYVDGYSGYVAEVKYEGEAKYADNYNKKEYNAYEKDYAGQSYDPYKVKKQYTKDYPY